MCMSVSFFVQNSGSDKLKKETSYEKSSIN